MLSAFVIWGFNNKGFNNENGKGRIKEKVLKGNKLRKLIKKNWKVGDIGEKVKKNHHLSNY
jgi:hypothetical protein